MLQSRAGIEICAMKDSGEIANFRIWQAEQSRSSARQFNSHTIHIECVQVLQAFRFYKVIDHKLGRSCSDHHELFFSSNI
jgi:hypothetical protein